MKRLVSLAVLFTITFSISLTAQTTRKAAPAQQPAEEAKREVLTNESIISLVRAQFKEKTILALLRTSPVAFDLSAPKLIHLKRNGVNETVIQAMIQRQAIASDTFSLRDEEFFKADDDEFFNSPQRLPLPDFKRPTDKGKDSGAETDIFGSRSGGQSQTRSRGGMSGDRSGSSEVAGSATVRIIKPPTEGSEPKLERAPRLSNQQVVDMVQAGFSEGTILRRIEMEQVEFDLSPKAIEELRKNRVSDKVVKAMRTAMDESK